MSTLPQVLDTKLQVTISDEAMDRVRVAAVIARKTMGQIITDLAIAHLPPVPGKQKSK